MPSSDPARVLVVANRTAATPALLEAVRARAASGAASFTLLVPAVAHGVARIADPEDADTSEAQASLDLAIPLLEEAAGGPVEGIVGDPDPFLAMQDAVNIHGFDELIISTLSPRVSRWLRLDLPRRLTRARDPDHHRHRQGPGGGGERRLDSCACRRRHPTSCRSSSSGTSTRATSPA